MSAKVDHSNPLWRLRTFLDIVSGNDPETNVSQILIQSYSAFRRNIDIIFQDEQERRRFNQELGKGSAFHRKATAPSSDEEFADAFDEICVEVTSRLRTAFALGTEGTSLCEQYLIDGLDLWASDKPLLVDRMVIACGIEPALLEMAKKKNPCASVEFIADIVFPLDRTATDWLVETCQSRNAFAVDASSEAESPNDPQARTLKRARENTDNGNDESDLIVDDENIDNIMMTNPGVLPKSVVRAKRKPLDDPSITAFEMDQHYTLVERRR